MFVKLEDEKSVVLAPKQAPDSECQCVCGREVTKSVEPAPAVDKTSTALAVYYDING